MMTPGGQGWNDPPSLSYETHSQTTTRRNLLTKRVGLPDLKLPENTASPPQKNSAPPSGQNLPPPPLKQNVPPAPPTDQHLRKPVPPQDQGQSEASQGQDNAESSAAASGVTIFNPGATQDAEQGDKLEEAKEKENVRDVTAEIESMDINFIDELKKIVENCKNEKIFSSQVGDTILKKIAILEKQVTDRKLPEIVSKKVENLTKYLVLKKYDEAWNIHLGLACDHSSSVMQWMVGVKKLITEAKKLQ